MLVSFGLPHGWAVLVSFLVLCGGGEPDGESVPPVADQRVASDFDIDHGHRRQYPQNAFMLLFNSDPKSVPTLITGSPDLAGQSISITTLISDCRIGGDDGAVSVFLVNRTKVGKAPCRHLRKMPALPS